MKGYVPPPRLSLSNEPQPITRSITITEGISVKDLAEKLDIRAKDLIARLLAYLLEFEDGLAFSRGISDPDEPAIVVRDLTAAVETWIEVGTPDVARLHKASKAARRVVAYTHKDPRQFLNQLAGEKIHRADRLELYALDRALVGDLVARLDRRVAFSVSVTDRELYIAIGAEHLSGAVMRLHLDS